MLRSVEEPPVSKISCKISHLHWRHFGRYRARSSMASFESTTRGPPDTRSYSSTAGGSVMNPNLLIDSIVQQTMVLIGQLATSAGIRAPLSHVADQVFLDLVRELEAQGVRQKVVADMFGMALRTYQKRIQRVSQSATDRGRTLWEAIYDHIAKHRVASRVEVLQRFSRDEDAMVRGILKDMVENGLIFESGTGQRVAYRVASEEDLELLSREDDGDEAATFVWAAIYRLGPTTADELQATVKIERVRLQSLIDQLVADGRVQTTKGGDEPGATMRETSGSAAAAPVVRYRAARFLVPLDARVGWAAAVFDHYQGVVQTIVGKLAGDDPDAPYPGRTGGSTWSFDLWPGHPHEEEVLGLLASLRTRVEAIQQRVFEHNEREGRPPGHARVTLYLGQSVRVVAHDATEGSSSATKETP
ncbi:MAG: hypothetical protein U1F43_06035 [Myxococcota bacterium]